MKLTISTILVLFVIGVSVTTISAQSQYEIPSWVKGVASYWANGNISDSDFGEAISFLIEQNVIKVNFDKNSDTETKNTISHLESNIRYLTNQNNQLKNEITTLNKELDLYKSIFDLATASQPPSTTVPKQPTMSEEEINFNNYLLRSITDTTPSKVLVDTTGKDSSVRFDLKEYGIFKYEKKDMIRFDFEIRNLGSPFQFGIDNVILKSCDITRYNNCYDVSKLNWKSDLFDTSISGTKQGIILFEFDKDDCNLFGEDRRVTWEFTQYHDITERTLKSWNVLNKSFC